MNRLLMVASVRVTIVGAALMSAALAAAAIDRRLAELPLCYDPVRMTPDKVRGLLQQLEEQADARGPRAGSPAERASGERR